MKDILILQEEEPCSCPGCEKMTYFAVFQPYQPYQACSVHLLPLMRKGSYAKLLARLGELMYLQVGLALFEPQRAAWEALLEPSLRWEHIGQHVHAAALAEAERRVALMRAEAESEAA